MRKKSPLRNRGVCRSLKKSFAFWGTVFACVVIFCGIWISSGRQEKELAQETVSQGIEAKVEKEAITQNMEEEIAKETVNQSIGGETEKGTEQSEPENIHQPVALDTVSSIEPQQNLEFSDVQAMAAGNILDVSELPQELLDSLFYSEELSEEVQQRIWGSSYQENDNISLAELRYLRVLHIGFDGETHIGELIVNQAIANDIVEIMSELYKQEYPIEKMVLIDEYGADDESSMSDNNTSAFNYREIAGSSKLSRHALGLAIDINPRYNPYVKEKNGELFVSPANGAAYADRSQEFSYRIAEGDLCLRLFREHGFTWGGSWNSVKDYQHFEK